MIRRVVIFLVALAAFSGSLVALMATQATRDFQLRGYVDATQDQNLPYRLPRLGVNAELSQYNDDELAQHLHWMQQAGVDWVRQIIPWDTIEPEQGNYQWATWDRIMQALEARPNLQLIAVITGSPTWARGSQTGPLTPPDNPADLRHFAQVFAARYGHIVDVYQIWDEPNLWDAWGESPPHTAEYAAMLCDAYSAIHSVDERATVIAAALAPTTETGPRNISDINYLRDLYAIGAGDCFDAAAAKPYGFNNAANDRAVDNNVLNFSRIIALREIMVENGDGRKALWASNWGWNSLPSDWQGGDSIWGQVDNDSRIQYTLEALDRVEREWPWLGGMILHHWQPDTPQNDPVWGFTLINQDNQPSPLWTALVNRPQPTTATNGLYHPVNPYARYSGVWTFGPLGADIGWLETSDSQLEFDFHGTDIALLLREDNYVAFLYPQIDGQPANAAPKDNEGNAYIFLRSASLEPEINLVPVARDLTDSQHTMHIITDKGWDRWALAGYAISSGNLATPYNNQITIAFITTVIAAIAVITAGWRIPWKQLLKPFNSLIRHLDTTKQLVFSAATSIALMIGMLLTWGDGSPALLRRDTVHLGAAILTTGIIYINPSLILTIISVVVLFIIIYNRIELGLALTLFCAPFFLFPVELYRFAFPLAEIMILLTTGAWILQQFAHWGRRRQSSNSVYPSPSLTAYLKQITPLDYGVITWVTLGCIALLWSELRGVAITELRTLFIEPALFYVIIRTIPRSDKTILLLVNTLIAAGFTVAVLGLVMPVFGQGIITAEGGTPRLASVYGSPNNVALFLGRTIPFALTFVLIKFDRRRRITAGIALIVMMLVALLTQSVGAIMIGIPAAVALILVVLYRQRGLLMIVGLAIIGTVAVLVMMQFSPRFASLLDFTQGTNFFRLRVWESAINIIQDQPITGLGLDQFLYDFRGHYIRPDAIWDRDLSHPHNFILDIWTRLGLFGVFVFAWIQIAFWRRIAPWLKQRGQTDNITFVITTGLAASMVNLLAHGLIDNSVFVLDLAFVFMLLLALAANRPNTRAIDLTP